MVLSNGPNSLAISETTRKHVIKTAREMGYKPNAAARALATGQSRTILIVAFDIWDENLIERLRGVESHLIPHDYTTRMCTVGPVEGTMAYSRIITSGLADGVLLTGAVTPDNAPVLDAICREAAEMEIPVVALTDSFPRDRVKIVVDIDDEHGAREAIEHLIWHGHRKIAFIGVSNQHWSDTREKAYMMTLEESGIKVDPSLIFHGDLTTEWVYDAAMGIAGIPDCTALFTAGDCLALPAISGLKAAGKKIPQDFAIVGFDDSGRMSKYTDPPLTTVHNPFYETGKQAAEILLALIEGRPVVSEPLPVHLVIRKSCGCNGD